MAAVVDMRMHTRRSIVLVMIVALACAFQLPTSANAASARPQLDSLSSSASAPGTSVKFRGSGFGARLGTSYVMFNGIKAEIVSWKDTEIVATVPSRCVAGYAGVTVGNLTSNGMWFAPTGRPHVVALSSFLAPPGSTITILGTGFGTTQRTGKVTFPGENGPVTAPVSFWSDTRIVCVVPDVREVGYMGVWQNGAPSNGKLFMPFLPPSITAISKQKATPGSTLIISGRRFGTEDKGKVKIGGKEVTAVSWSDTSVTIVVPDDAPSGYLGVVHGGSVSNGVYLYVVPRIESLSSWWVEPGAELTIGGSGFSAATRVTMAGQSVPIVSQSAERLVVTVPSDAREGLLGVWNGLSASNGVWVLPIHKARITGISSTVASPGDSIVITGEHFGTASATSVVRLGDSVCSIVSWSDDRIVAAIAPDAKSGYVGVWKRGIASNGRWITLD